MVRVEAAYATCLGDLGVVEPDVGKQAAAAIEAAKIDPLILGKDAATDGMPVPSLVRQLRGAVDPALHPAVHSGLTTQDVMDTALSLALADLLELFEGRMRVVCRQLDQLNKDRGAQALMGRTRMQAALPITLGDRVRAWLSPLENHVSSLGDLRTRVCVVQVGGPVGNGHGFAVPVENVQQALAEALNLGAVPCWHSDRSRLVELGGWLARLSGTLGKIGHDIALMAQQGIEDVRLAQGGRSSAMAHKSNPVRAETLVALARHSSVQIAGLHLALDHEQERSGASWMVEWLTLPSLLETAGASLLRASELLETIEFPDPRADNGAL
jgi:3-carboxy-cis,cis-muconate cycloisomerase